MPPTALPRMEVTDLAILLIALVFLCAQPQHVKRSGPLVLAALFWGLGRLTVELGARGIFQDIDFNMAVPPTLVAQALSMTLCALCMYWACRGARAKTPPPPAAPPPPPAPAPPPLPASAKLERLRQPED